MQKIFVSDISNDIAGQPWPTRHRLKAPILEQNHLWIKQAMLSIKNQDYKHTFKFSFQEMYVLKSCCYTFLTTNFLFNQINLNCKEIGNNQGSGWGGEREWIKKKRKEKQQSHILEYIKILQKCFDSVLKTLKLHKWAK